MDSWNTAEQVELAQQMAMPQLTEMDQDELETMFRGVKGVTYKRGSDEVTDLREPLAEPDDMTIVTSPCHGYEPVKVPDDHTGAVLPGLRIRLRSVERTAFHPGVSVSGPEELQGHRGRPDGLPRETLMKGSSRKNCKFVRDTDSDVGHVTSMKGSSRKNCKSVRPGQRVVEVQTSMKGSSRKNCKPALMAREAMSSFSPQ